MMFLGRYGLSGLSGTIFGAKPTENRQFRFLSERLRTIYPSRNSSAYLFSLAGRSRHVIDARPGSVRRTGMTAPP
jgi:hypothetical protein